MIGKTISHYKITERLGAGGMGEVFLAEDTMLGRQVALKFLPESMWNDANAKERLIREARAASQLDHPNIVTIHGIEEVDSQLFIVMSHVRGVTLDAYLAVKDRTSETVTALARQITEGLQHAHGAGVIHRDLKPGNILVDDTGRARILDFGIARMQGESHLTHTGSTVGTLAYTPPELIEGGDAALTSDIYSFGVVLYQMLAGQLPFQEAHDAALLYAILNEQPRPLADFGNSIPEPLNALVMRCLEKEPQERFADCSELADALSAVGADGAVDTAERSNATIPSIAVLPFLNMSRDEDNEYFSDGLAEELLNVLAKISGLHVAARVSSFQFKGKTEDPSAIGRKLKVATLLDGSVRKSGNRVRISVQLVKVSDGYHLWSETYDRTLDDIFAVQDDIAQSVVQELRTKLLGERDDSNKSRVLKAEVKRATRGRSQNAEAHRLYLQGKHQIAGHNREQVARGIEYFDQALELDPDFALAWTALASAFAIQSGLGWVPVDVGFPSGREALMKALSLEPELAEAHGLLGWIQYVYDRDWKTAEASYRHALELEPDNPNVVYGLGFFMLNMGNFGEAMALLRRTLDLDPLNSARHLVYGIALEASDRLAEAEDAFREALELSPKRVGTRDHLALTVMARGRLEEALEIAKEEPHETTRLCALAIVHYALKQREEAEAALKLLIAKHSVTGAYQVAQVYTTRGEIDAAFEWLEKAYEQRDAGLTHMKFSPYLRKLHGDPRWVSMLKKMGFED